MSGECPKCSEHALKCLCPLPIYRKWIDKEEAIEMFPLGVIDTNEDEDSADHCGSFPRRQENGWISVKDRLPSDDRRVLGTDGKNHEIVCCINSDCEWVGATSDYGYLMSLKSVTHWMPLPEPPKE